MSPTETVSWLAPAPIWGQGGFAVGEPGFLRPWIAEFESDQFLTEFLALLAGDAGEAPSYIAQRQPAVQDAKAGAWRLYQPLHQRYYLMSASLVCRTVGIPDRRVDSARGEAASFVMRRRLAEGKEQAWIQASSSWQPVALSAPPLKGEERLPLHAAPVGAFADPRSVPGALGMSEAGRRSVFYGYIPAGRRERLIPPMDPAVAAANLQSINKGDPTKGDPPHEDPRFDELMIRVVLQWQSALQAPLASHSNGDTQIASLYLILDLGDWLSRWLPVLYAALPGNNLPAGSPPELHTFLADLNTKLVRRTGTSPATITLREALVELKPWQALVAGNGPDYSGPNYDLTGATTSANDDLLKTWMAFPFGSPLPQDLNPPKGKFATDAKAALGDPGLIPVPDELRLLLRDDPAPGTSNTPEDLYVLYAVYEHPPCATVMSRASIPFTLAPAMDPDAPARQIRIQLPDIAHMRRFKRGVGLEMPPKLRQMVERINAGMLIGGDLNPDPGLELGMICSFSIQIIFLVAFLVMFIFLIAFNIIFWWLAFLKICFPIPHKKN
ncbi:MAG: hypothetical protein NVSMB32_00050 [Actinomycetota bacterium]